MLDPIVRPYPRVAHGRARASGRRVRNISFEAESRNLEIEQPVTRSAQTDAGSHHNSAPDGFGFSELPGVPAKTGIEPPTMART
ncbi:MAG: hypothetical protein ABJC09_11605, partial [Terriglobia bacterium]